MNSLKLPFLFQPPPQALVARHRLCKWPPCQEAAVVDPGHLVAAGPEWHLVAADPGWHLVAADLGWHLVVADLEWHLVAADPGWHLVVVVVGQLCHPPLNHTHLIVRITGIILITPGKYEQLQPIDTRPRQHHLKYTHPIDTRPGLNHPITTHPGSHHTTHTSQR